MASQVQIPFEGVILQEHSAPISCPTPNFAKGSLVISGQWLARPPPCRADHLRGNGPIVHEDEPRMDTNKHE